MALGFPFILAGIGNAQTTPPQRLVPQGSPVERVAPVQRPATTPETAPPPLPPPGAEVGNRTVRVTSVSVEGATVISPAELDRLTAGLAGPSVPMVSIDKVRQDILQEYRSAGYVLSTVSASLDAPSGKLRYIVTEGHIASVKLDGDIGPAGVQVLRFLNRLTEYTPISAKTLERYLLLAQDVPGVHLRAVLQPSAEEPGALNLIAQVTRDAVSGLASFDNRAFDQTGPIEALLVLDLNSFTSLGEKTELSFYHTFPNSQNFGQIGEEFFIGGSGLKMRLYAGQGISVPSGGGDSGLAISGYHGYTKVLGGALTYPVIRSRQQTLNVGVAFDMLEAEVKTGSSSALTRQSFDSLRIVRLQADYVRSDIWAGAARPAVNQMAIRFSHGFSGLGSSHQAAPDLPRPGEHLNFNKMNFEISRTQTLFAPWEGASVAVMGLLAGQWSSDVLPPAEQFYLGGSRFTRGYYAGQVPGDKALAATVELQLNTGWTPTIGKWSPDISAQFYLFYDWGETWQNQSTDFATKIASAGGGVRLQVTRFTEVDLEALGRFNRFPTGSAGSGITALNGIGLFWRVLGRF